MILGMQRDPVLFIHGGPGMNSVAERRMLGPRFDALKTKNVFWNEPSSSQDGFSDKNAYGDLVESARHALLDLAESGGVHLISHSFGANAAMELARSHPEKISRLTFVSPATAFDQSNRKILGIAMRDFESADPSKSTRIAELLTQTQGGFDGAMQEAFGLAAQDPALLSHYWKNKEAMAAYFQAWAEAGAQLDLRAFMAVILDFDSRKTPWKLSQPSTIPTDVVIGTHDPVIDVPEELRRMGENFPSLKICTFEESGHFAHLEEIERLISHFK